MIDVKDIVAVLGQMRVVLLALLIAANSVLGYIIYNSIQPQIKKLEYQTRVANSEIASTRVNLSQLREGFDVLLKQRQNYLGLEEKGFFDRQSRYEAGLVFEAVQEKSKVLSAKATVKKGEVREHKVLNGIGYRLLQSEVEIDVRALDDIDILYYIESLEKAMPGHLTVTSVKMERGRNFTGRTLKEIARGVDTALATAKLKARWTTMISEDLIIDEEAEENQ